MQLGSHTDVAHAKGLGFAVLSERQAAETKRKAQEKNAKEEGTRAEDKSEDDGDYNPE